MADIRQNPTIKDNFNRANETPIAAPWVRTTGIWNPANLRPSPIGGGSPPGLLKSASTPPTGTASSWSTEAWDGDDAEVWARAVGNPPVVEGWRIGLMKDLYPAATDGYVCLPHNNVGVDTWQIRRYTNNALFNFPGASTDPLPSQSEFVLMRRNGALVEVWRDNLTNGANWTLVQAVADSTYTVGLYATLGGTGSTCGWDDFGGGPEVIRHRTQIYRWLSAPRNTDET